MVRISEFMDGARERRGWGPTELADAAGLHPSTYYRVISEGRAHRSTIWKLARALHDRVELSEEEVDVLAEAVGVSRGAVLAELGESSPGQRVEPGRFDGGAVRLRCHELIDRMLDAAPAETVELALIGVAAAFESQRRRRSGA